MSHGRAVDERIKTDIKQFGYVLTGVFPVPETGGCSTYTIGLTETYDHPELLLFAIPLHAARLVLDDLILAIKTGQRIEDGALLTTVPEQPLAARLITPEMAAPFTRQLRYFYRNRRTPPEVIQLIISDQNGVLPWQPGFNEAIRMHQPELWERMH